MPTLPPVDPATAAWLWDSIGKEFVTAAGGGLLKMMLGKGKVFAKDKWEKVDWKRAAQTYRARMKEQYNQVILIGSSETKPLEGIFTDVVLLDKPSAERGADLLALNKDPQTWGRDVTRLDAVTLVKKADKRCLMVLGKPGAGKTTFLKHLVLEATDGRINKIPVFVSLKRWADSEFSLSMNGLLTFITAQFDICGFPDAEEFVEYILQKGLALVLLDGLDEINLKDEDDRDLRSKAIQTIRDFVVKFDKTQFVMTCRVAANEYQFADFKYCEVANFNDEQIESFVDKWFKDQDYKLRDSFKAEFTKPVNKGLRDLAASPILLSLVCLAYEETHEFPPGRKTEIYKQAVDALMRKWDISRGIKRDIVYRGLSQGQKENLIAYVANQTFDKGDYFVKKSNLAQFVEEFLKKIATTIIERGDGEIVLRVVEAQHGIWVERAHGIYSFSHLSLQEYFTADYIIHSSGIGALQKLLIPEHISDTRWREVILNTAGLLGDANEFFELFEYSITRLMKYDPFVHDFFKWVTSQSKLYSKELVNAGYTFAMIELIGSSYYYPYDYAREAERNRIRERHLARANAQELLDLAPSLKNQTFGNIEEISQAIKRVLGREPSTSSYFDRDKDEAVERAHNLINKLNSDIQNDLKNIHEFDNALSIHLDRCLYKNFDSILPLILDVDINYSLAIVRDRTRMRTINDDISNFLPPKINNVTPDIDGVITDDVDLVYRVGLLGSIVANSIEACAILESRVQSFKAIIILWEDLKRLVKILKKSADLTDFDNLVLPQPDNSQNEWLIFAKKARELINMQLNAGAKMNFSEKSSEQLISVFSATQLMLECLDATTVSPEVRQRVRDNILTIKES